MAEVIEFSPRTPGTRKKFWDSNVATWGFGVQADGSLVMTVIDTNGTAQSFFVDHALVSEFERQVALVAAKAKEIASRVTI